MIDYFDLIVDNDLEIERAPKIVWCRVKRQEGVVDFLNEPVGVKYKETNGDKRKAVELAIERALAKAGINPLL
jgi:hypothetical protein